MVEYKLHTCVWEITKRCNYHCAYCGSRAGQAEANELSIEACLSVARQLKEIGCQRVVLIGGEVFLKEGWQTLLAFLAKNIADVSIITNGALIDAACIEALRQCGVRYICLSIDGLEQTHDAFRCAGSFKKALQSAELLKESGFLVSVVSTLNARNVNDVEQLYCVLGEVPVDIWQVQVCSPFGNAHGHSEFIPDKESLKRVCDFAQTVNQKQHGPAIVVADNIGYYTHHEPYIRGRTHLCFHGCSAGLSTIGIDSVGNVKGCESLYDEHFIEGNLRDVSLRSIWENPTAFSYNRQFTPDLLEGACKTCSNGHICAGGCRSFNYFYSGKMYESKLCLKQQ